MTAAVDEALARLASSAAVLAPAGENYGVYPGGDRRRRPIVRLAPVEVRDLEACGAIEQRGDGAYVLSEAGKARVARSLAREDEAYLIQHAPIEPRTVIDRDGDERKVRGVRRGDVLRRLAALRDAQDLPWLSEAELEAARRLRADWDASQAGLVRGSDWSAPPMGAGARGVSNAQERAMAARCDARRRVGEALDALAAPLRRVVERVCLHEDGLEALERAEGWPARSGKLVLKIGLAQMARGLGE
ncbi:MAG TPA: DUF6456 domain-containing protein [Vitreimonas sp.]|uniref:DUF6456 domain-containing protein n=1 Tax=Vitreimonas sp. TaxID=3069702 RepID=UPI002D40E85D|nr:DUF6456 domain-containing protein [Vitreimonas sp.]HYD89171.1 DUF6456 domain-containing protein [Vitreimonas sp.]